MTIKFLLVTIALLVSACSGLPNIKISSTESETANPEKTIPPLPKLLSSSFFGEPKSVIPIEQVYSLTAKQKQHFLEVFNSEQDSMKEPHKRVYQYLENHLTDFNYYSDTLNASESLIQNRGNCLSLAILTKTLADLAGVKIAYQLVETAPVFKKEGNIIVSSQHIRSVLYSPVPKNPDGWLIIRGRIYIDYFPTFRSHLLREVDEAEFKSMYYTNKAAESMIRKDDNLAFWYLDAALGLKSNHSHAINMMALLHENVGYPDIAEKLYLYGIEYSQENLDLLNNYHSLLKSQQRTSEAKKIAEQIGHKNNLNPYKWISLGNTAYNSREYNKAIRYYRKANKLAPYLHEGFAGIARSKIQLGNPSYAKKAINQALENTHDNNTRKLYQAKLDMLSELLTRNTPILIKSQ